MTDTSSSKMYQLVIISVLSTLLCFFHYRSSDLTFCGSTISVVLLILDLGNHESIVFAGELHNKKK